MASERTQVYVHIGPPKTGTTYLQDVLWGNRDTLRHLGVTLPGKTVTQHFHAAMDLRDVRLGGHEDPRVPGTWNTLAGRAQRVHTGTALISHELFAGASREQVARLAADLDGCDIHVVYTARDLGRQLPAVWQETLKNRSGRTFDGFLKRTFEGRRALRRPHYFWTAHDTVAVLDHWSAAAPPERIHVITAPPPGAGATELWSRFAKTLGFDPSPFDLSVARPNNSLSKVEAEVLRRVNASLPEDLTWPDYQRLVKRRFNHLANSEAQREKTRIPELYREPVLAESERVRSAIAAAGYQVVGDLDDLLVGDNAFGPEEQVPPDEVAASATMLLAEVLLRPVVLYGKPVAADPNYGRTTRDRVRDLYYLSKDRASQVIHRDG